MDTISQTDLFTDLLALENAIDRRPLTVSNDAPIARAIAVMGQAFSGCTMPSLDLPLESLLVRQARASSTLVVEGSDAAGVGNAVSPLGIFTQWDAVQAIAAGLDLTATRIGDAIARDLIALQQSELQDIFTALSLFDRHQILHLPVVNKQTHLVGVVTPESIRQVLQPARLLKSQSVSQAMTKTVVQAQPTDSILHLAQLMAEHQVRYIVICDSPSTEQPASKRQTSAAAEPIIPVGTITARDIVQLQALAVDLSTTKAEAVMNPAFCVLRSSQSLLNAYGEMQQQRGPGLVMSPSRQQLQGIVTLDSLLKFLNSPATRQQFRLPTHSLVIPDSASKTLTVAEHSPDAAKDATVVNDRSQSQESPDFLSDAAANKDRLLATMSLHIRKTLELGKILNTTVTEVRQFLQADRVSVYRFNPDWSGTIVVEAVGEEWIPIVGRDCEDNYFSAKFVKLYRRGRIQSTADIYTSDLTQCHIDLLAEFQVRAILVVPILQGEELWGLLGVHQCSSPREWQSSEIELLENLANHIAIAIQQSELYRKLELELAERKRAEERIAASLHEKEILLKEIHHRVKNNLQVISSLLKLQSGYTKDDQAIAMFKDSQNRIRSMALIHEKLYQSQDLARINFSEYVQSLAAELLRSYRMGRNAIALNIEIDEIALNIDTAIPCGLLINELVSNALKHAFKNKDKGEICIQLQPDRDSHFILSVSDNGIGFPQDLDFRDTESLGLQLVCTLTEQLEGTVELNSHHGTTFNILFQETKR